MLTTNDIFELFKFMADSYGHKWSHEGDAVPVWRDALKKYNPDDIFVGAKKAREEYPDFPPTVQQFVNLVGGEVPMLPPPGDDTTQENIALANRVYQYTKRLSARNPKGNPHGVDLPESIAIRKTGESAQDYEFRIRNEVTFAMYPRMREKFENRS